MKKILFILLLFPVLVFGQATGKIISDKPSGGSIGSAVTTVDAVTLINLNQTTAGQTLTVPNLTNATAGKIIYISNVGSVALILSPGGLLLAGYQFILRWTGSAWSASAAGSTNPTTTYIPYNNAGTFSDSWLYQVSDDIKITNAKRITSANGNVVLDFGSGTNFSLYGDYGRVSSSSTRTLLEHDDKIEIGAPIIFLPQFTPNTFPYVDGSNNMIASTTVLQTVDDLVLKSPDLNTSIEINNGADGIEFYGSKLKLNPVDINFPSLDASTVPVLDASKNLISSSVTETQLSYVDFTSSGQTQINTKLAKIDTSIFNASDFNQSGHNITIDYTNGQAASGANKGFLTSSDWTLFNGKESALTFSAPLSRSTNTISIDTTKAHGKIATFSDANLKAPKASPTFTGTVTIPTPFTLGATSVTSTGTQLNYLNAATGTSGTTSTNLLFSGSPTIVTPTIASFTNATHNHSNAAGGGQIALTNAVTGSLPLANGGTAGTDAPTARTNLGLVIGTNVGAISDSYFTWTVLAGVISPADATSYYTGSGQLVPSTSVGTVDFNIGIKCTIIGAVVSVSANTTAGSNENITFQIRNFTQSTSHSVGTFTSDGGSTTNAPSFTFTGLNIAVAASDAITCQFDTPTWATNPQGTRWNVTLILARAL